ncbi:DUF5317 family protein [Alicyclobacillus suci]|uniref:DUF5317 family protein n=1 Tax=Alicyclobacillus suci TaxID=2816080 RepID=UPI001A8F3296|nr:DUF5317 family protein [Alicyclobacillus suci]
MPYFVGLGILLSLVFRRNLGALIRVRFKYPFIIIGALFIQILLNAIPLFKQISSPWILDVLFFIFIVGLLANWKIQGVPMVLIGASLNLFAIVINHGVMPVSLHAYTLMHHDTSVPHIGTRHVITSTGISGWIVDWIPVWPYLMSPGDILVGIGVIQLIFFNSSKRGEKVIVDH